MPMGRLIPRNICNSAINYYKVNYLNDSTLTDIDDLAKDISKWTGNPTVLNWTDLVINDANCPNGLIRFHQTNDKHQRISFPATYNKQIVDMSKFVFDFGDINADMPEWEGWAIFRSIKCDKIINLKLSQDPTLNNFTNTMFRLRNGMTIETDYINEVHFADGYNKVNCLPNYAAGITDQNACKVKRYYNLDFSNVSNKHSLSGFKNVEWFDCKGLHINTDISNSSMNREAILHLIESLDVVQSQVLTLGTLKSQLTEEDISIATKKGWTIA